MSFVGALINHRGNRFGIIKVKPSAMRSSTTTSEMQSFGRRCWGHVPIVLADTDGRIKGPTATVRLLSSVTESQIPWRNWTVQ